MDEFKAVNIYKADSDDYAEALERISQQAKRIKELEAKNHLYFDMAAKTYTADDKNEERIAELEDENKRLKKTQGAAGVLQQVADKLQSLTGEQNVWKAIELLSKP